MSILSNEHTFALFVSGKSQAHEGQRLAVIGFKTVEDKVTKVKTKRDSQCVSIPQIDCDASQMQAMKKHIVAMLEKTQDAIIRERVLAGQTSVNNEHITFQECLNYLDAEEAGSRLKKEDVEVWFDVNVADKLKTVFKQVLGVGEVPSEQESKALAESLNHYRTCFASLAGGKKVYKPKTAAQLLNRLLQVAEEGDEIAEKFAIRLEKMSQVDDANDAALI